MDENMTESYIDYSQNYSRCLRYSDTEVLECSSDISSEPNDDKEEYLKQLMLLVENEKNKSKKKMKAEEQTISTPEIYQSSTSLDYSAV